MAENLWKLWGFLLFYMIILVGTLKKKQIIIVLELCS